jgi:hypothetical protein
LDERVALEAVYPLSSSQPGNLGRGTAFACFADATDVYLLTSARLVAELGGPEQVRVYGERPTVVATGAAIDVAVLRLAAAAPQRTLPLAPTPAATQPEAPLQLTGFVASTSTQWLASQLMASYAEPASAAAEPYRRLRLHAADDRLEAGFRGAPVIDLASGYVIGVADQLPDHPHAVVIAVDRLREVWPNPPAALFQQPALWQAEASTSDEVSSVPPSEEIARVAQSFEEQARELTPPDVHDQVAQLARLLLTAFSRGLPAADAPAFLGISPEVVDALQLLAGKTLVTPEATLAFGSGEQFGQIRIGDVVGRDVVGRDSVGRDAYNIQTMNVQIFVNEPGRVASTAEPPPTPLAVPVQVYLSSEELGSPAMQTLRRLLALRGLSLWPDDRGILVEATAQPGRLRASAAALLHLTADRLDDDDLSGEVAALRERYELDKAFPVGVILEELRPAAVKNAGFRLKDFRRFERGYSPEDARAIAQATLDTTIAAYPERFVSKGTAEVSMLTFPPVGRGLHAPLQLDWQSAFKPFPSEDEWRDRLLPALDDLREALGRARVSAIKFYPQARLSAALAFGYVFRETTKVGLWVSQSDEWWPTRPYEAQQGPARIEVEELDAAARDLTLELSVTSDVTDDVTHYLNTSPEPIARRVKLSVPTGSRLDATAAQAIACQVREAIHRYRPSASQSATHLFAAIPAGLATLIGWHLNAREPVQCYELERGAGYRKSCRLTG